MRASTNTPNVYDIVAEVGELRQAKNEPTNIVSEITENLLMATTFSTLAIIGYILRPRAR